MKFLPRRLILIGLFALALALLLIPMRGQANEIPPEAAPPADVLAAALDGENTATLPPPPEQDPCLHCHIEGQIENEWSPISRWLVFGTMGLTFVLGLSRNMIVWQTRARWQPRWMDLFIKITAAFFLLQVLTGLLALIFSKAAPEILVQVLAVSKAIHWGSAIALFIAALALSFAGAWLPGYARALWAMIFITGIISGALGLANLSFAYLYGEWHDPVPAGHLYGFHILLIPIALAGLMSIYLMLSQRKRGAAQ